MDDAGLRELVPQVIGVLVRRGTDFASAEDAVQEALVEAAAHWPDGRPANPRAWLVTVARRKLIDAQRSESARRRREEVVEHEPLPEPPPAHDDTLLLYALCCHPSLTPASAVALTLRAVGGLTTAEVAEAYGVPEATMAARISRAKRALRGVTLDEPGDLAVVLHVLYLVYTAGHGGRVDLATEAIRLTRQLARLSPEPEVRGLLALMLLHHARRAARFDRAGRLVRLDEQDRSLWDRAEVAEGVALLQGALAEDRRGEYQLQAAIAALHDDAPTAAETDWAQVLEWYDELVALSDNPFARLGRAVAVGHVRGAGAGLAELSSLTDALGDGHRLMATRAYLHELGGDVGAAVADYAEAARRATSPPERDHYVARAALLRSRLPG